MLKNIECGNCCVSDFQQVNKHAVVVNEEMYHRLFVST